VVKAPPVEAVVEDPAGYELDSEVETGVETEEVPAGAVVCGTRQEQADDNFDGELSHPGAGPTTLVRSLDV
jgi:hypothetical protein